MFDIQKFKNERLNLTWEEDDLTKQAKQEGWFEKHHSTEFIVKWVEIGWELEFYEKPEDSENSIGKWEEGINFECAIHEITPDEKLLDLKNKLNSIQLMIDSYKDAIEYSEKQYYTVLSQINNLKNGLSE